MIGVALAGMAGIVALAAAAGLAYRTLRQRRVARTLTINTPTGIAEGRFIRVGDIDQWIQIRGTDRANPILLIVGGHGLAMEPFTATLRSWEQHFTVVLWDRRGVGRTRGRNGSAGHDTWTFDQLATDGLELVEFLCRHLHHDKVILVGHSQGTLVAVPMIRRRPDLFHAYVGTAQVVDMARNEHLTHHTALDRARRADNHKAVRALRRLTPPYTDAQTWITKVRCTMATDPEMQAWQRNAPATVLTWPGYTLADVKRSLLGALFLPPRLFEQTMSCTPEWLGTRFEIPFFLFHGDTDLHVLPSLAERYLATIDAPTKAFVRLPDTGHLAMLARPDPFLAELLTHVRPLATTPATPT